MIFFIANSLVLFLLPMAGNLRILRRRKSQNSKGRRRGRKRIMRQRPRPRQKKPNPPDPNPPKRLARPVSINGWVTGELSMNLISTDGQQFYPKPDSFDPSPPLL